MPHPLQTLPNIEKSVEANVLWPPLADALSTFIRRRAAGADGYELTWRLIHVWEAAAAVLTGAVTTRLRGLDAGGPQFLRCREHLHGRTWDALSRTFHRSQGALDGSATRRIDLLWDLENFDVTGSRFLASAKQFLNTPGLRLRDLVDSWKQICEVPHEIASGDQFTVREAFRHVNTFRNRFAHVPFPFDEMAAVSTRFADVTERLFSVEPLPWQTFPDERIPSPLNGGLETRGRRLRGSMPPQLAQGAPEPPHFVFPAIAGKAIPSESWDGSPFVHVDSMFRPSILTRLISEANGVWEYTRFLAERNSVIRHEAPEHLGVLPVPAASEYPVPAEEQQQEEVVSSTPTTPVAEQGLTAPTEFDQALRHIANEEYEPAIAFFKQLVENRPEYHIGWLRLGHAQRELAMRRRLTERDTARALFDESIRALQVASQHSHQPRRAQALYELSKAYYHRSRLAGPEGGSADLRESLGAAIRAFNDSPDTRYETWIAYLRQHGANDDPPIA